MYHVLSQWVVLIGLGDGVLWRSHHCGHYGIVECSLFLCGLLQDLNKNNIIRYLNQALSLQTPLP